VHRGQGPPVLLVHGFLSSRAHWTPNLEALCTVCTPVVVELFGHGRSPAPTERDIVSPAGYVAQFEELRADLGVSRWAVVGHSLGGALVLTYALAHPARVSRVVFTNSQSALADDEWRRVNMDRAPLMADRLRQHGRELLEEHPMHPRRGRRLPPDVQALLIADYELLDPAGLAALVEHTAPASSVRKRVGALAVPALLTVGLREQRFAAAADFARDTITDLQVVELPGAGHNVNLHDASGWNEAVVEFLRPHPDRP
jgi:pimeloyl-ACP methyl ester carboxylesterase